MILNLSVFSLLFAFFWITPFYYTIFILISSFSNIFFLLHIQASAWDHCFCSRATSYIYLFVFLLVKIAGNKFLSLCFPENDFISSLHLNIIFSGCDSLHRQISFQHFKDVSFIFAFHLSCLEVSCQSSYCYFEGNRFFVCFCLFVYFCSGF